MDDVWTGERQRAERLKRGTGSKLFVGSESRRLAGRRSGRCPGGVDSSNNIDQASAKRQDAEGGGWGTHLHVNFAK